MSSPSPGEGDGRRSRRSTSAGLMLYRTNDGTTEVLLGHMGGPFWARKDAGAWTVPKGEYDPAAEDAHDAAVREFTEELGTPPPRGPDVPLGTVRQRAGKEVTVWARHADLDVSTVVPGTFTMEWPPRSGRQATFPELDRVAWCSLSAARTLLVPAQVDVLDRLAALVPPHAPAGDQEPQGSPAAPGADPSHA